MTEYNKYITLCKNSLTNDYLFDNFKQNPNYSYILEQTHLDSTFIGNICIEHLIKYHNDLLNLLPWSKYQENDLVGNPKRKICNKLKQHVNLLSYYFSQQTLRYILRSLNIFNHIVGKFGTIPNKLDIVEIGGAYGGQCKILLDTLLEFKPELIYTYTIIDSQWPSALQKKYLETFKVKNLFYFTEKNYKHKEYDLCICSYTIEELPSYIQNEYIHNIVLKSKSAYILWNNTSVHNLLKQFTVENKEPLFTPANITVKF